jgi:hypothetical protein
MYPFRPWDIRFRSFLIVWAVALNLFNLTINIEKTIDVRPIGC